MFNEFQPDTVSPHDWFQPPHRILVVDDEPRICSSMQLLLEEAGREIQECRTGYDAIAALSSQSIDLVLLDIFLPDISGLEVLEWMKINNVSASVIIVSVDNRFESAVSALRGGVAAYVRKPHDMDTIKQVVENCLAQRQQAHKSTSISVHLRQSEQLYRFMVEKSPDLIYTLDPEGRFIFVNSRIESLLGYTREEAIGSKYTSIIHDEDQDKAVYAFVERRSGNRATSNREFRLKGKNDSHIFAMFSAIGLYDPEHADQSDADRRFVGTYGVARDITARKLAEDAISFHAMHDQLTQLPNRRLFSDRLEQSLTQAKRHGGHIYLMYIDLDRFKHVNDIHGHAVGDQLLKSVSLRLRSCMRASDTLSRQGGDEFTVLLTDITSDEGVTTIAGKILNNFRIPFHVAGETFRITASIGISAFPRDGENSDNLLHNADIAMLKAKKSGKNRFRFYSGEKKGGHRHRTASLLEHQHDQHE